MTSNAHETCAIRLVPFFSPATARFWYVCTFLPGALVRLRRDPGRMLTPLPSADSASGSTASPPGPPGTGPPAGSASGTASPPGPPGTGPPAGSASGTASPPGPPGTGPPAGSASGSGTGSPSRPASQKASASAEAARMTCCSCRLPTVTPVTAASIPRAFSYDTSRQNITTSSASSCEYDDAGKFSTPSSGNSIGTPATAARYPIRRTTSRPTRVTTFRRRPRSTRGRRTPSAPVTPSTRTSFSAIQSSPSCATFRSTSRIPSTTPVTSSSSA